MNPCKMLICGSGGAGMCVARVASEDGRATIAGLFDPIPSQLQKAQQQFPDAVTGADYEQLLDRTNPDIVVVAGPDHLHADQTILALEHGCHVLVEKPLATTSEDAQRIVDAQEKTDLHLMTDHTVRYTYPWREMALAAKSGDIGRVFFIQGDYIHDMWSHYAPAGAHHTPWRIDKDNPQNILLGGGCHPIDLIQWTIDAPVVEVFCYGSKLSAPDFPDNDCYIVVMRFENEVLGKVYVSSGCSGEGMETGAGGGFLAVYGTEGTLWKGKLYRRGQEATTVEDTSSGNVVGGHGWGQSVVDFLDVVEGKTKNPIPARVGARTVALCDAALESIRTGKPQCPVRF